MPTYIALLRGVNVGGTGKLSMKDLSALCTTLGHVEVRTYIQSGNVIFSSSLSETKVRSALEQALHKKMGKPIDVMLRTADELRAVLEANPFPDQSPASVGVIFLHAAPHKDLLQKLISPTGEQVRLGKRELYIYYPIGMGQTKLKLTPVGTPTTTRNINTVAKLVALAST
jgi:uncharacterized protein (DUF1697 family)